MSTIVTKELSVALPQILEAQDYHDFYNIECVLNQVFAEKIKVEEIGFNYKTGQYEGVVFCGRSAEGMKKKRHKELQLIELASDLNIHFDIFQGSSSTTDALFEFVATRMSYDKLHKLCSHDNGCKVIISKMQEHVALGTARKMAKEFLIQQGYGQDDIDAYA